MPNRNQYTAQQFIDAIADSAGIISTISRRVGCAWHTAQKYILNYPTVKAVYDDECEKVLDLAETVVLQSLKDKDVQMAKWYLSVKGADRGYQKTQHLELTGAEGAPLIPQRAETALDKIYGDTD